MKQNGSFLTVLVLAILSGAMIGYFAFGSTDRGKAVATTPAAESTPAPGANAPKPATSSQPDYQPQPEESSPSDDQPEGDQQQGETYRPPVLM